MVSQALFSGSCLRLGSVFYCFFDVEDLLPTVSAEERFLADASRELSADNWNLASIVARIDVVSYCVWSTPDDVNFGEITSAGIRVPGPH